MTTRNSDAPATDKQLNLLKILTGKDWTDEGLTKEEASEKISRLQEPGGVIREEIRNIKKKFVIPTGKQPFNEPQVTLILGEQRSGKTNTAVGKVVDAYDRDCVRIYCDTVLGLQNFKAVGYDRKRRIAKIKIQGKVKYLRIPETYKMKSPMRIFCNFHLKGVKYVNCPSFNFILDGLRTGLILDGWLIMDEYYIGGYNRSSSGALQKALAQQSNQYAKRMLNVIIIAPLANQLDWTARLLPNETIHTEYNKRTKEITCRIKKKGVPGVKEVTYKASKYWGNYWTNETVVR